MLSKVTFVLNGSDAHVILCLYITFPTQIWLTEDYKTIIVFVIVVVNCNFTKKNCGYMTF